MRIKKGPFAGYKVAFADSSQVERLKENVDRLMRIIAEHIFECSGKEEIDDWMSYCLVTDMSSLSDFLSDGETKRLSEKLGFSVEKKELIFEVAMRMGKAN